jgi:DHA1 family inner membrane transport protein
MMQTSTQPEALSRGRTNLALATLFLGVFVLGSGELLVVGLLTLIAADLQVSIPTAGVLVTAHALGLAIRGRS